MGQGGPTTDNSHAVVCPSVPSAVANLKAEVGPERAIRLRQRALFRFGKELSTVALELPLVGSIELSLVGSIQ